MHEGRVRIGPGSAQSTGLPDASVDVAVAVNNVPMWPSLEAGAAELRRVLHPDGVLYITWHRSRPSLALEPGRLDRISAALAARFTAVERTDLPKSIIVTGTVPATP